MVFHDSTLDRMTDRSGRIADHTPEALGEIALHGGAEIPTLARALAVIAGRVPLLVELKDQSGCFGPGPIQLEAACAPLLAGYDGPVAVISYNPHMIAALARLAPRVPRGLITRAFTPEDWPDVPLDQAHHLSRILDADRVGAALISHYHADLPSAEVARQRRAGRAVLCWTIRNPTEEATALGYADAITFEGYRPTVPSGA